MRETRRIINNRYSLNYTKLPFCIIRYMCKYILDNADMVNYISAALPRPAIYDTSTPGGDFGAKK